MLEISNRLKIVLSSKFAICILFFTWIFFEFFDIFIFKFTRNFNANYFYFFEHIIHPISNILNPLNILTICSLFFIFIFHIEKKIKIEKIQNFVLEKIQMSPVVLLNSINFYKLVFLHIISSLLISGVMCHILKYILGVSRPKYFFLSGYDRIDFFNLEHKVNSLPSGHTQAIFSVAILFLIYFRRFYILTFLIATLVAISRIFMSMHFPSDLILGAYIGMFFPLFIFILFFQRKLTYLKKEKIFDFRLFIKLLYLSRNI